MPAGISTSYKNRLCLGVKAVSKDHSQLHFCATSVTSGPGPLADPPITHVFLAIILGVKHTILGHGLMSRSATPY